MDRHIIDVTARFDDQLSAGAKKADDALEKLEDQAKKTEAAVKKSGKTKFDPQVSTSKVDKLMQKLNRFASKAKSGVVVTVKALDKATATLNKVGSVGAKLAGKTFTATVKIADYATRPIRGILGALTSVQALIAGVATGAAVNYGAIKPVSLSDQIKRMKMAFSTQLGGETAAQSFLNEIYAFDKQSPFDTMQIAQQAQLMLNTGWQRNDILPDLENIGDWAAAMGKGEAGISSVVIALGQMRQKGRVYAEEMLQLTEAGVSGWEYLAQSLGVSTAQVREMVEDGAVSVDDAIKSIIGGMDEFAGTAARTANETIGGMLDQIVSTLKMGVVLPWGEGLSTGFGKGLQYLKDQLSDNQGQLTQFGEQAKQIGVQIGNVFSEFAINGIDKVKNILSDPEFQNLSIGGKIQFAWDEMIAQPFSEWWDVSGKQMVVDAGKNFAGWLGDGIIDGIGQFAEKNPLITTLLGAMGISKGVQTVKGLLNFGGGAGSGASAVGTMTVTAGVVNVNGATSGISGTGVGGTPQIPAGAGGAKGIASSILGGLSNAGFVVGGAGILDGIFDLKDAVEATGKQSKDFGIKGTTKMGMVGAGAAAGAAIGSAVPIAGTVVGAGIGAGVGGIVALTSGDSIGQWISDQFDTSRAKKSADRAAELMGLSRQGSNLEYLSNAAGLATDALAYTAPSIAKLAGNNVSSAFRDGLTGSMITAMQEAAADPSVSQSVTSMLNRLKPTTAQIESIAEGFAVAGKTIPQSITDYLSNVDFYTALAGGTNELQNYFSGLSIDVPVDAQLDPSVQIKSVDPTAAITAALAGKVYPAQANIMMSPNYLYQNTDLDPTQMGDGWDVTANPDVSVIPFYNYLTGNFNKSALTPSGFSVDVPVSLRPQYNYAYEVIFGGAEAAGGMVSRYGLYSLAEEGTPEMVIPLGSHRRDRGVELWERAGHMLGIPGFFNGGIAGDEDKAAGASRYTLPEMDATGDVDNSVTMTFGDIVLQINGANDDIIEELRARAAEVADVIAGEFVKVARARAQNSPRRA